MFFFAAYEVLITPDNPVIRIFRGEISDISANIIIGPYPVENDIKRLSENGIKTIISLLDPLLPYEKELLDKEIVIAKKYGFNLLNFPMASIFGQKLGAYYENNAKAAVDAIGQIKGKVYLHCYLGIHRVGTIKKLLEDRQINVGRYLLREGERSQFNLQLDIAEQNYLDGHYHQATQLLDSMKPMLPAAILLHGWVDLRLGNIASARNNFNLASATMPETKEPLLGLAYCALHENNLKDAETLFSSIIKSDATNIEALNGMGLIRFRQNILPEAIRYLEDVLKLNPQHAEATATLQRINLGK